MFLECANCLCLNVADAAALETMRRYSQLAMLHCNTCVGYTVLAKLYAESSRRPNPVQKILPTLASRRSASPMIADLLALDLPLFCSRITARIFAVGAA
jgi:hypothetical protein